VDWADANVEFQPRPLEAFGTSSSIPDEFRSSVGESATDALELAKHTSSQLYADDLGLRRIASAADVAVASFSTVSLLQALAETGDIPPQKRDQLLVDLAERHYNALRASPELLIEALKRTSPNAIPAVFSLLAAPSTTPVSAARTIVRAVKIAVSEDIQTTSTLAIVRNGLAAMALKFPPRICAQAVTQVADDDLMLLPNHLQIVKRVCLAFLRQPWGLWRPL
jgi:hypothetical protein